MLRERLEHILADLHLSASNVEGAAVLTTDGLLMAGILPKHVCQDRLGSIGATLASTVTSFTKELDQGAPVMITIQADQGLVVLAQAGEEALLAACFDARTDLAPVRDKMLAAAGTIAGIL